MKAKIYYKLRWYYLHYLQDKMQRLLLYKCYMHLKFFGKVKNSAKQYIVQYMTKIVNPTAGIGDQLASWISGYYYAKQLGLAYAYSPLYPEEWNRFLGFFKGETEAGYLLKRKGYKKVWLPYFEEKNKDELKLIQDIIASYQGKKVIFYIEISQVYGEQFGVMDELRQKFNAADSRKEDRLRYQEDRINIAVHVRRGDIAQWQADENPQLAIRWLDNDYYVNVLKQITDTLEEKSYKIYLFSQGKKEEFKEFEQFGEVEYCMDMSARESFLHMVRADILVTSKSSFSYKPALLSEGIRICPKNFWHGYPDNERWILADDTGKLEKGYQRMTQLVLE